MIKIAKMIQINWVLNCVFKADKPTLCRYALKSNELQPPPEGLQPHKLRKASGCSSPLEGEQASDCNGSCTSGAVGGQKLTARTDLRLTQKLKQKKSINGDFLILFLNFALIKYLTPHPNPLPASGERGMEGIFYFKD